MEAGRELFLSHCSFCHGEDGKGVATRDLTADAVQLRFDSARLYSVIVQGIPCTGMPGFPRSRKDVLRLMAFVRNLAETSTAQAEPQAAA